MTHSPNFSRHEPARPEAHFTADEALRGWLRASLRASFLQRLIGREPTDANPVAAKPRKKSFGDLEESWTVCLDRGANAPVRRLSILSDRGAAPAMRIESVRTEKIFSRPAQPEIG